MVRMNLPKGQDQSVSVQAVEAVAAGWTVTHALDVSHTELLHVRGVNVLSSHTF